MRKRYERYTSDAYDEVYRFSPGGETDFTSGKYVWETSPMVGEGCVDRSSVESILTFYKNSTRLLLTQTDNPRWQERSLNSFRNVKIIP